MYNKTHPIITFFQLGASPKPKSGYFYKHINWFHPIKSNLTLNIDVYANDVYENIGDHCMRWFHHAWFETATDPGWSAARISNKLPPTDSGGGVLLTTARTKMPAWTLPPAKTHDRLWTPDEHMCSPVAQEPVEQPLPRSACWWSTRKTDTKLDGVVRVSALMIDVIPEPVGIPDSPVLRKSLETRHVTRKTDRKLDGAVKVSGLMITVNDHRITGTGGHSCTHQICRC